MEPIYEGLPVLLASGPAGGPRCPARRAQCIMDEGQYWILDADLSKSATMAISGRACGRRGTPLVLEGSVRFPPRYPWVG